MGSLESAIDETFLVDVRGLPDGALQEDIGRLVRAANRIQAAYLSRLEVLDRRGAVAAEHGSTGAWLREQLNVSATVAGRQVHLARDLADVLPDTAASLAAGEISVPHCQVIAGLRKDLSDDCVRSADPHLADAATTHTPHELLGFVTHVRHAYRPDLVAGDERDGYDERTLTAASTLGGLGVGRWSGDPVSQELIMTAIHAASAPHGGDDRRTAAQRRFDGLVAIGERALNAGELPDTGGVAPHVSVIVDYATLINAQGRSRRDPRLRDGDQRCRRPDARLRRQHLPDHHRTERSDPRLRPRHPQLHRRATPGDHRQRPTLPIRPLRHPRRLVRHPPQNPLGRRRPHQHRQRHPALRPPPPPHPPPRTQDRHRPTRRPMTRAAAGWQPVQVENRK
jgi:hypothetical protein